MAVYLSQRRYQRWVPGPKGTWEVRTVMERGKGQTAVCLATNGQLTGKMGELSWSSTLDVTWGGLQESCTMEGP